MTSFADIERMVAEDILGDSTGSEPETAELVGAANWLLSNLADRLRCGNLSPDELGELLELVKAMEPFAGTVQWLAHEEATTGRVPTGYKLVQAQRNRRWTDPSDVVDVLVEMPGVRLRDVTTLISPRQMEQRLGANLFAKLDQYVTLTAAGTRLVSESSKKPAIGVSAGAPAPESILPAANSPVPELRPRRTVGTRKVDNAPKKAATRPARPRRRFGKRFRAQWSRH